MRRDNVLFHDGHLFDWLRERETRAEATVEQERADVLLNEDIDTVTTRIVERFLIEPLNVRKEETSVDQREIHLDVSRVRDGRFRYGEHRGTVPAVSVTFFVPFSGDAELFRYQPSSFTSMPPRATVKADAVEFGYETDDVQNARLKDEFEAAYRNFDSYVRSTNGMVEEFNRKLPSVMRRAVERRRERLLQTQQGIASLGYPLRVRPGMPQTYSAPSVRRKIAPAAPSTATVRGAPAEPALSTENYEHIIKVMENMALVLERSPSAFETLGEEHIRWHFVVQLNGHFEGAAMGETFNVEGKTDILIRVDGKNIFIAECKFWKGSAGFMETIDQLLGYTSWRDTKTAIVIFNRDTALSTIIARVPEALRAHPNFKRQLPIDGETRFRAVLRHKNDPDRELTLTVLVFDVPRPAGA